MNTHSDVEQVLATIEEELQAVTDGDAERYFSALSDRAVFLAPNQPLRAGNELRTWLREFLQAVSIEWLRFEHIDTEIVSDLAYHTYTYSWRATPRDGGAPTLASGKGLHILRREKDGFWRITREIWNVSPEG